MRVKFTKSILPLQPSHLRTSCHSAQKEDALTTRYNPQLQSTIIFLLKDKILSNFSLVMKLQEVHQSLVELQPTQINHLNLLSQLNPLLIIIISSNNNSSSNNSSSRNHNSQSAVLLLVLPIKGNKTKSSILMNFIKRWSAKCVQRMNSTVKESIIKMISLIKHKIPNQKGKQEMN